MAGSRGSERLVYPAPSLVVGVGRFGLAVLERLGEDWYDLSRASVDPSLANLRLLHVGAEDDDPESWRRRETESAAVAGYVGDSDLPSLALDLAILRSLGLVRYRDGNYQVALPRDAGAVKVAASGETAEPSGDDGGRGGGGQPGDPADTVQVTLQRRRFFAWRDLSPDPVVAAERLKHAIDRNTDLDLFVTPILNRVRQGHSPRALLACVARAAALCERRDPPPWPWLWEPLPPGSQTRLEALGERIEGGALRCSFEATPDDRQRAEAWLGVGEDLATRQLEGHAPAPIPGWDAWRLAVAPDVDEARLDEPPQLEDAAPPRFELSVPEPFVPRADDMPSWLPPRSLLGQDWLTTGWVTDVTESDEQAPFHPVPASSFRLGLFDHDRNYLADGFARQLATRFEQLGRLVHQGLVRLWLDLHRERVEERQLVLDDRRREHGEEALRQSLEILGELLVRKLLDDEERRPEEETAEEETAEEETAEAAAPGGRRTGRPRDPYAGLSPQPSEFLRSIVVDRWLEGSENVAALTRRLEALGLAQGGGGEAKSHLLRQVRLDGGPPRDPSPSDGEIAELRQLLNREVRQLFGIETLASYRDWPTRRPPRLTVFLVGDVGEPFVRATLQPLLREIHAELLRSFGPILEYFREGFDRGLSVQPILWMPHPADAFEGGGDDACRREEAAIINSVHRVRRWVEAVVPPTRRRVSQIFVNSRVTDVAVLDLADAIRQTRDFLTLQIRNDLSRDEWLRQIAEGPPGDDYFASFTCYEIDFPAEKAREYLANRLARDFLRRLKSERSESLPEPPQELLEPPQLGDQVAAARSRLASAIEPAADRVERIVEERAEITPARRRREILADFDVAFEDRLLAQIQSEWRALSRERGGMDRLIDTLRIRTSTLLGERVAAVRRHGDRLIEDHAAEGGVQAAIAGFGEFGRLARLALEERDAERRRREDLARRHDVPETRSVETARGDVLAAAEARPEETPIRVGLALWLLLAPALGAPLAHALAYAFDLDLRPNWLEPLLGPWGWATGGALVAAAGWFGVRAFQRRRHRRLLDAVARLARAARRVLEGAGLEPHQESRPSVRSFLDTRLLLAEGLAARGFSLQIFERVEADHQLAARLNRSIDVEATRLARQVEDLGVRPTLDAGPQGKLAGNPENDDVRRLFTPRSGSAGERLIDPRRLVDLYRRWAGDDGGEIERLIPRILAEAGGFAQWRESACLSDTAALLAPGRREFAYFVDTPLPAQHRLAEEVGLRLCRFVARYYSNMGFGARFTGYEGLDPDGVHVRADAALILHPDLAAVYQQARHSPDAPRTTATMRVVTQPLRRSSAYMLSLAQGIRAHSVRNLKRFESFHGRSNMPEDRTFPLSDERQGDSLNLVSRFTDLAAALHDRFRHPAGPPPPAAGDRGSDDA